jgi:hypothetical protein
MQAPPPLNTNGATPQAVNGHPQNGPTQEDVHEDIKKLSVGGDEEKGNSANSTSRRLAQTAGALGGHTFKKTVGNSGSSEGSERYILPHDVDEAAFLAFIEQTKQIVGADNVTVNVAPGQQADADYESQPKFYVGYGDSPLGSYWLIAALPNHRTSSLFNQERIIWHPQ